MTLILILIPCSRCSNRIKLQRNQVRDSLLWHGSIRYFMEAYLDYTMMAMLNIEEVEKVLDFDFIIATNWSSRVTICMCGLIPILLLGHSFKNRQILTSM